MDLKKILKKAFDAGYDTSVMYNCGDGNAYEDFESFYINEIKQLTLTYVSSMFSAKQMEQAFNDGAKAEQDRCGEFDI